MQEPGLPDIIGQFCGSFYGIELKVEPRKLTPIQKKKLEEIAQNGGIALHIELRKDNSVCTYACVPLTNFRVSWQLQSQVRISTLSVNVLAEAFFFCVLQQTEKRAIIAKYLQQRETQSEKQMQEVEPT